MGDLAFRIPLLGWEAVSEDMFFRIYLLVDLTSRKALVSLLMALSDWGAAVIVYLMGRSVRIV